MKQCNVCKQEKPLSDFYRSSTYKDGHQYRCKVCDGLARIASRNRDGAVKTRLGYRRRSLKLRYGLTVEQYDAMLLSQGNVCAICGTDNPCGEGNLTAKRSFAFAVDHCHISGNVRGILCNSCNRGLGFLKDSSDILRKAANYLENNA